MLAYHYYDGDAGGVSKLELAPIRWTADGCRRWTHFRSSEDGL
jgi:hypothetical protein